MTKKIINRRTVALRPLLSRLWRQRDAPRWTIHGHDQHRRPARLRVGFGDDGVTLDIPHPGPVVLAPMQAGRLRGAIRDAIDAIERPAAAVHCVTQAPTARGDSPNVVAVVKLHGVITPHSTPFSWEGSISSPR